MSDPVTNAEIEDVLSSIRRLVSEEPGAVRRRRGDTTLGRIAAPEKLVLTPALRVPDAGPDLASDPDLDTGEAPEAELAEAGPGLRYDQSLEARIAELESAISLSEAGWEPDGSEEAGDDETATLDEAAPSEGLFGRGAAPDEPEASPDSAPEPDEETAGAEAEAEAPEEPAPAPDTTGREATLDAIAGILAEGRSEADAPAEEAEAETGAEPQDAAEPEAGAADEDPQDLESPAVEPAEPDLPPEPVMAADEPDAHGGEPQDAPADEVEAQDAPRPFVLDLGVVPQDDAAPAAEAEDSPAPDAEDAEAHVLHAVVEETAEEMSSDIASMLAAKMAEQTPPPEDTAGPIGQDGSNGTADPGVPAGDDTVLDEETLRQIVTELIRDELKGALGQQITRNLRRMVRREIQRAFAARDAEQS